MLRLLFQAEKMQHPRDILSIIAIYFLLNNLTETELLTEQNLKCIKILENAIIIRWIFE